MATIPKEFIKANMKGLASQLGGFNEIFNLPADTIISALAHSDDVLAITRDDWVIEIADMDTTIGYEVYNKDYDLLYNEAADLGLANQAWGTTERDIYILWVLGFGEYIYLTYQVEDEDTQRVLMLVKF